MNMMMKWLMNVNYLGILQRESMVRCVMLVLEQHGQMTNKVHTKISIIINTSHEK